MACAGAMRQPSMDRSRRSTTASSAEAGSGCPTRSFAGLVAERGKPDQLMIDATPSRSAPDGSRPAQKGAAPRRNGRTRGGPERLPDERFPLSLRYDPDMLLAARGQQDWHERFSQDLRDRVVAARRRPASGSACRARSAGGNFRWSMIMLRPSRAAAIGIFRQDRSTWRLHSRPNCRAGRHDPGRGSGTADRAWSPGETQPLHFGQEPL